MRGFSRLLPQVGLVLVCLLSRDALAQYRNDGIAFEIGVQGHEHLPYTAAMFAGSEAAVRARSLVDPGGGSFKLQSCAQQWGRPDFGLPCMNSWFGITDGIYVSMGYQRALGDLLLDLSENPIIRNLWFTYRGVLALTATLPTRGFPTPAFMVQNEVGLRWNLLDEHVRPFVAVHGGLSHLVEPVTIGGRAARNAANCDRLRQGEQLPEGEFCAEERVPIPNTPVTFSPSTALFVTNAVPTFLGVRPEIGVEYFFMEDVSVQVHGSVQLMETVLPSYWMRAPFVGISTRVGGSVVAYF